MSFEREGQRSSETVTFTNGQRLQIHQDGCNTLRQRIELSLMPSPTSWETAQPLFESELRALASVDRRLFAFAQYAEAVASIPADFPEGEPASLAPGLSMQYYRLPTGPTNRWGVLFVQEFDEAAGAR